MKVILRVSFNSVTHAEFEIESLLVILRRLAAAKVMASGSR